MRFYPQTVARLPSDVFSGAQCLYNKFILDVSGKTKFFLFIRCEKKMSTVNGHVSESHFGKA